MKSKLKKELFWIIGVIFLTLIIGLTIFGSKLFNGRLLDLQLHDKYFIFPKALFLTAIFILLLGSAYLIRGIYLKLNNRVVNILLTVILVFIFLELIDYLNWIYGYVNDSGYYLFDQQTQTEKISEFTITHWILIILIVIVILAIGASGYKIVKPAAKKN